MRLNATTNRIATNIKEFAYRILKIGDVNIKLNENGEEIIEISTNLSIQNEMSLLSLV